MANFTHEHWSMVQEESCYEGFFKLIRYHFKHRLFEGGESPVLSREIFVRGDASCVLLYDPDKDSIVLVEQFRIGGLHHSDSPWMLELVAGINEESELPADVVVREAQEEAGADVLDLMHIYEFYPSPGGSTERIHLFVGLVHSEGLGGVHGLEEEGEDIKVHVIGFDKAMEMLKDNKIDNSPAIIALQWLALNKQDVNEHWSGK
ncbi:ADP-ribose pyrophosphatase [Oleiphilus sp. HI0009]|nr:MULTISPECIES: NUDIX domain-containing protein [unclassified Oleiphilus]KZX84204.1 ADP-ribose pyrophosphatase [Oleiphilus sp. HI0009]KZY64181.1 ADP-ribose pyrophosphatase [Oleiphilus sp. HI0066]KZY70312.1 ADP-ribose pyrophosphatase [Oleiphilus sp. HI0067]KZZ60145.1 ADP-ribose pyrophosphatase [Oleiphilus sp. HI0125]